MIFTLQTNGTYIVDLDIATKTTYFITTSLKINDVEVATALPYTWTPSDGVFEFYFKLTNINATYEEKRCVFIDKDQTLFCKLITKLNSMNSPERLNSKLPYYYYLLKDSVAQDQIKCDCMCDGIKNIYAEIKAILEDDNCC